MSLADEIYNRPSQKRGRKPMYAPVPKSGLYRIVLPNGVTAMHTSEGYMYYMDIQSVLLIEKLNGNSWRWDDYYNTFGRQLKLGRYESQWVTLEQFIVYHALKAESGKGYIVDVWHRDCNDQNCYLSNLAYNSASIVADELRQFYGRRGKKSRRK